VLSIDFRGAFDHLKWRYIREQVAECGLPQEIEGILASYLSDRWAEIAEDHVHLRHRFERGGAQGSVLGPLLWNMALEPLLENIKRACQRVVAYVDDVAILVPGGRKAQIEERAESAWASFRSGPIGRE